jgi:hypothetical protein
MVAAAAIIGRASAGCGGYLLNPHPAGTDAGPEDTGPDGADAEPPDASLDADGDADADTEAEPPRPGPWVGLITRVEVVWERVCDVNDVAPADNCLQSLGDDLAAEVAATLTQFINEGMQASWSKLLLFIPWCDDLNVPADPDLRALMIAVRGTTDTPLDDFTSGEDFLIQGPWLTTCGEGIFGATGRLEGGALELEGESLLFPLIMELIVPLAGGRLFGTIAPGGQAASLTLCGHVTARELASAGYFDDFGRNLLEVIIFPEQVIDDSTISGVQPDIDNDGDELETFYYESPTGMVAYCLDGDLSRIDGRSCWENDAIRDSYSFTINLEAVPASLGGCTDTWQTEAVTPCRNEPVENRLCGDDTGG